MHTAPGETKRVFDCEARVEMCQQRERCFFRKPQCVTFFRMHLPQECQFPRAAAARLGWGSQDDMHIGA